MEEKIVSDYTENSSQWPLGKTIRQMLIHYIDVGSLSPNAAKEYVEEMKDDPAYQSVAEQLQAQGVAVLWLPVRPNSATRLESVSLDDVSAYTLHPRKYVAPRPEGEPGPISDDEFLLELANMAGVEVEIDDDDEESVSNQLKE
jgi:hypothetical protein